MKKTQKRGTCRQMHKKTLDQKMTLLAASSSRTSHSTLKKCKNEVDARIKIQQKIDPFGGFLFWNIPLSIWADLG